MSNILNWFRKDKRGVTDMIVRCSAWFGSVVRNSEDSFVIKFNADEIHLIKTKGRKTVGLTFKKEEIPWLNNTLIDAYKKMESMIP